MLIWFAAGAAAIVWFVFQSPAIDQRMVMAGAVLPLAETPWGDGILHALVAPTMVMVVVMASTVGRRLVRRRWLGVPIGMFLHLVLNGSWARAEVFWWPARGWSFPEGPAAVIDRGLWSVVLELAGVGIAAGLWRTFGLNDADRRSTLVRTGQLDREFMKGSPGLDGTC